MLATPRLTVTLLPNPQKTMKAKRIRNRAVALALCCAFVSLQDSRCGEVKEAPRPAETGAAQVLVAYYSLTGNTEQMAGGVAQGVRRVPSVVAHLKRVDLVSKQDLEAADAIILGCPTYYANIPGKMKEVIDDWSWKMKVDFTDKIGGAFATGGGQVGGKEHVVVSLLMFMLSNRMIVAGPLYQNDKTGSIWGEVGSAAMTGPLDPGVSENELDSARLLGERVARLAQRLKLPHPSKPAGS
jgi:NAD(P)H dehydrogenase (quinone)